MDNMKWINVRALNLEKYASGLTIYVGKQYVLMLQTVRHIILIANVILMLTLVLLSKELITKVAYLENLIVVIIHHLLNVSKIKLMLIVIGMEIIHVWLLVLWHVLKLFWQHILMEIVKLLNIHAKQIVQQLVKIKFVLIMQRLMENRLVAQLFLLMIIVKL